LTVGARSLESLPDPLSSFIGREIELAEIADRLGLNRLVTLTGAGGSGKTRLAIEAARRRHEHFADGLCWVDLAPVEDPALAAAGSYEPSAISTDYALRSQ